ncbi:unnamed protein product [Calypogeia fissa]
MKGLGKGGHLTLLIVSVLVVSNYLFAHYSVSTSVQRLIEVVDDPSSEVTFGDQQQSSSSSDPNHGGRDQQANQQTGNVSTNWKLENGEVSSTAEVARPLHEGLKRKIWEVPPAGTEMQPLAEFSLRKEMVEFRAEKNIIVVTFANHAFLDFALSWVKSLTDCGVTNLLVGAMDTQLLEALYWAGIPTFDMGSNMNTTDVGWGSPTFHKMGWEKVMLVNAFLSLEYEVLMCDSDVVWLRNPLPYLERYPDADLLTSTDLVVNSVDDESLEIWDHAPEAYNIGIDLWRPTPVAKKFAVEWMSLLLSSDDIWDQDGFNDLMRSELGPEVINGSSSGLFYSYDGTLKLGFLPVSVFCSGHTYFVQELYKELGLQPYAVHTTFQYAGTAGKRHRLREAKLFYDPPDYYNAPGGFISYTPSLPENLLTGGAHTVESHFNLVNHQLRQVRSALAIASTLNRTLIMPELWCRLDRLWFGHPGILPGSHTKQPFLCPMDHIFDINMWLTDLPDDTYGTMIQFREYSFLDNPQLPSKVKASTLKVTLCELGTEGCNSDPSNKVEVPGALQLPMNSTEDQLKAALSYIGAQVIEFSSMLGAFGVFSDEARATQFSNRVKVYTGVWCCTQDQPPGHIGYDIYWDERTDGTPLPPGRPEDDHQPSQSLFID